MRALGYEPKPCGLHTSQIKTRSGYRLEIRHPTGEPVVLERSDRFTPEDIRIETAVATGDETPLEV